MSRAHFIRLASLVALGCLLFHYRASAAPRPNILFILSDDQGMNDVSAYGSEIPTPNIDSIAKNGVKFESYYVASPICTPSRFGFLTGRFPNRSQDKLLGALMFLQTRDDVRGIRPHERTIAEVLKEDGYRTAIIGKWHLGHGLPEFVPNNHGFDYSYGTSGGAIDYFTLKYGNKPDWFRNGQPIEEKGYSTDLITADAVRYLKEHEKRKPFFLYLAYTAPHYGKGWADEIKQTTNPLQAKDSDRERFKHIEDKDRREFAGMVAAMDDGIGRVLATLKEQNLDQNTLVIFTCDNGADPRYGGSNKPFRGQKAQLFEGGIRVPCLAQWPAEIKPGSITREPVTGLDWFPTFCELAGVSRRKFPLDGQSIVPVLLKNKSLGQRVLFWQLSGFDALRIGEWKYIRTAQEEMVFDLKKDPYETNNIGKANAHLLREFKEAHSAISASF
jgi:arylsulfatase A-like enzyme